MACRTCSRGCGKIHTVRIQLVLHGAGSPASHVPAGWDLGQDLGRGDRAPEGKSTCAQPCFFCLACSEVESLS